MLVRDGLGNLQSSDSDAGFALRRQLAEVGNPISNGPIIKGS